MELLYKPDWEQTKERYLVWWAHEDFGRCALFVTGTKTGFENAEPPPFPEKVEDRWLDFDYLHRINEYRMSTTFFGGEALPVWHAGYPGWDLIAAYLGCKVELMEDTGWVHPIIESGELTDHDYKELVIREDNRWWEFSQKLHRYAVEKSRGKCITGLQAIGGGGDTLAALRSTNRLLIDVMECPDYVRDFELYLMKQWTRIYDRLYEIITEASEGSTAWMHMWSPGRFYIPQNDFSYMISPKMFIDIFLPAIEMQVNFLDHSLYHVDGEGAFAHVDALLELKKLQAIQIQPGAGKPSVLHYMELLKKVQRSGKNLQIFLEPEEVDTALENLSSRGLLIYAACKTEEEAKYLLKMAEKWSQVRKV